MQTLEELTESAWQISGHNPVMCNLLLTQIDGFWYADFESRDEGLPMQPCGSGKTIHAALENLVGELLKAKA